MEGYCREGQDFIRVIESQKKNYVNVTNVIEHGEVAEVLQNTSNLFTILLIR